MNILVIGLGSMGKRRIRLIKELYSEFVIYGVDGRQDRCDEVKGLFNIECAKSMKKMQKILFLLIPHLFAHPHFYHIILLLLNA